MNLNASHQWNVQPSVNISRSKFFTPNGHKATFNAGYIYPLGRPLDVIPGSTYSLGENSSFVLQMNTPAFATMDNLYADFAHFFVPYRLVMDDWEALNGEADPNAWIEASDIEVPGIDISKLTNGFASRGLADHFGIPTLSRSLRFVSALYFRGYNLIYNEWYRDQNTTDPLLIQKGQGYDDPSQYVLRKATKLPSYFTTALPAPNKGPAVLLPLGDLAPVIFGDVHSNVGNMHVTNIAPAAQGSGRPLYDYNSGDSTYVVSNEFEATELAGPNAASIDNAWADLSNATAASINSLYQAISLQRLFYRDGIGGGRYAEILRSHFGVVSPDSRLQRPELLATSRCRLDMNRVVQTSANLEASPLGNTGGYSVTVDGIPTFEKSFTEHGMIITMMVIRQDEVYQQGLHRMWSQRNRFDFYWPELANIGEQPIYREELYAYGSSTENGEVFGYTEAYNHYRYRENTVAGQFRSNDPVTLNFMHYAYDFEAPPQLDQNFMEATDVNVYRSLANNDDTIDQFWGDFQFNWYFTGPLPVRSIPGLVPHF